MRTIRLAWPPETPAETEGDVFLTPDQARHGALVLRLKPGAALEVTGPAGLAPAVVSTVDFSGRFSRQKPGLAVRLTGPWQKLQAAGPRLALALIRGPRFDWAVEKSVELGAAQLIPLICERCKSAESGPGPSRLERWQRLAEEARKQCGRPNPMEILPPQRLAELTALPGPGFFLSPAAGRSQGGGAPAEGPSPLLAVGPEGGFSPAEEETMAAAGFRPLSLGPTVLRSETAALAVLALLYMGA